MTLTQKIHKLLSAGFNNQNFQVTAQDLTNWFGEAGTIAIKLDLLSYNYSDRFKCPECGATHEVVKVGDRYFIGCENDNEAGLLELAKDDLKIYTFNPDKLAEWLNSQLQLSETVEIIGDHSWYLGQFQNQGKTRKVYLAKKPELVPDSPGKITLAIGNSQHQQIPNTLNLLQLVKVSGEEFTFEKKQLLSLFFKHQPIKGDIVKISDRLILSQEKGRKRKSFIHFGSQENGQFENVINIKPTAFNIVYHLVKLRKTPISRKSSAEIVQAGGISTSKVSVTTRIEELNNLLTSKNWPKLILQDSDYRYYINPDLYTS